MREIKCRIFVALLSLICTNMYAQEDSLKNDIITFWNDFKKSENLLSELTSNERLDLIFEAVSEKFDGLYVECSSEKYENDQFHLILSANGNKEYFELVKALVNNQPPLTHFRVTGFRQANPDYEGIIFGGLNLRIDDMHFIPFQIEEGLAMEFYVPNENKEFDYETIHNYGSIAIDKLIGEVEFSNKIKAYDFYLIDQAESKDDFMPLRSLGKFLLEKY